VWGQCIEALAAATILCAGYLYPSGVGFLQNSFNNRPYRACITNLVNGHRNFGLCEL